MLDRINLKYSLEAEVTKNKGYQSQTNTTFKPQEKHW